jgi:hypothetical protein
MPAFLSRGVGLGAALNFAACAGGSLITGDPAPGTASGVVFSSFDRPSIGSQGRVALLAGLAGTGVDSTNNDAVYAGTVAFPGLVARESSTAPGVAGAEVATLGFPALNAAGDVLLNVGLKGGTIDASNNAALLAGPPGSMSVVARKGTQAPGVPAGTTFFSWGLTRSAVLSDQGHVAFSAVLAGDVRAVYAGPYSAVGLVAKQQGGVPGLNGAFAGFYDPVINGNGGVAFRAKLAAPADGDQAIVASVPSMQGTLAMVAQKGDPAPGTSPLVLLGDLGLFPSINNDGRVAFNATLTGDVTPSSNAGVWAGTPGNVELVARAGGAVGGAPVGTSYGNAFGNANINAEGRVTFLATIANAPASSDVGIFSGAGQVSMVVREGQHAPGTAGGVVFGTLAETPDVNASGQMAFTALLAGTGVNAGNDKGIWTVMPTGEVALVAREGDVVDLGFGQPVRIQEISMYSGSGGQDGLPRSLSDDGRLAFSATFTTVVSAASGGGRPSPSLPSTFSAVVVVSVPEVSVLGLGGSLATVVIMRRRGCRTL